ncbi:MAG: alanine dehydrogenase [Candidatus Sigynarchaeota archaeon]
MIIGVPKEIKDNEYRVGVTPGGVAALVRAGHGVIIQSGAGVESGFSDKEYLDAGAKVVQDAADVWNTVQMVWKVKEPQQEEFKFLREGLILYTYLHLAAEPDVTRQLLDHKVLAIAYETVQLDNGTLPLLTPMSEVAGRMAIQIAARYLERENGGRGKLLGGVPGVRPADVVVVGGGIVGTNAARVALGMGAHVTIIDLNIDRLRYLDEVLSGNFTTLASNPVNITDAVEHADVVIGAVLNAGAKAPKLVTREMVNKMKPGSVIVDVAIDQGGCIETAKPTKHSDPTFKVNDVIHYCVTNMPGAVPRTSTYALNNATLPYAMKIANLGVMQAIKVDPALARGVNTFGGNITCKAVAEALGYKHVPLP